MNPQKHADRADEQLRQALAAFERAVLVVPDRPASALPMSSGCCARSAI